MKILQLSSFHGNLGDNLSHYGLELLLKEIFSKKITIKKIEIRKTYINYNYKDIIVLDQKFAEYVNQNYDYFIIGGGSFFEPHNQTKSGFRLEFTNSFFSLISIPVILSSIGSCPREKLKYNKFAIETLNYFISKNNIFFGIRNDGSLDYLKKQKGLNSLALFDVLDNAFFIKKILQNNKSRIKKKYILVNLAYDQLYSLKQKNIKIFIKNLISLINILINQNYSICFVSHVPHDYKLISKICDDISDYNLRRYIIIKGLTPGTSKIPSLLKLYNNSILNITMRFHGNIISFISHSRHLCIAVLPRVLNCLKSLTNNYLHYDLSLKILNKKKIEKILYLSLNKKDYSYKKLDNFLEQTYKKYSNFFHEN